jgi:hypothetical protein
LRDDPDARWKQLPLAGDPDIFDWLVGESGPDFELFDEPLPILEDLGPAITRAAQKASKRSLWAHHQESGTLPTMLLVLGTDRVGWTPAIEKQAPGACEVCGNQKLGARHYCLACQRSGIDPRLPAVKPIKDGRRNHVPDPKGLKGGLG